MHKRFALVIVCVLILGLQACASVTPTATSVPTNTATVEAFTSTPAPTPTQEPTSTPTPISLAWQQISDGQAFERDIVSALATDEQNPDVIYAGMKNTGVYKTIDGGLYWQPTSRGLTSMQIESLLIDTQNPSILYAGTLGGVFKTEDSGENWFRSGDGTYLLMDWQDNSHLYARDENGIYETRDQGNSWETAYALKQDCPGTIRSWAIHPADGNTLFVGGEEDCEPGIYQSNNGGRDWRLIGMQGQSNINLLFVELDEQGNPSIYANHDSGFYASYDEGANWSHISEGGPGINAGCDLLVSDPENPGTVYCASARLFLMQKGQPRQAIPDTQSMRYTAIHIDYPNGTHRIIAGSIDISNMRGPIVGIFIFNDEGDTWVQRDNGLGTTRAELKIDPLDSANIYLATYIPGECRLYRSQDEGKSWLSINKKYGYDWCGPVFDSSHILYLKEAGALQGSSNGGDTWFWEDKNVKIGGQWISKNALNHALPSYYTEDAQSISANPFVQGFVYDVGNVIYYSENSGTNWQQSAGSKGLWDARLYYTDQSKVIYAIGRYHQAFSTDNGVTWQSCGEDVTASQSDTRLALDLQGSRLYLATPGQGMFVSTDECQSWQSSNEGLSNLFVNTVAIDPNNPDIVYTGTDGGAYISFDSGQNWNQINTGLLGTTMVYSIAIDSESNVYAATPYGIFKLEDFE